MLKRIKRAYKAFMGDQEILVVKRSSMTPEEAQKLSTETGKVVVFAENVDDVKSISQPKVEGDGKAEFLGEGTTEEFEELEKEDKGQKGIFGL